jgi:hypothetical protein
VGAIWEVKLGVIAFHRRGGVGYIEAHQRII